MTDIWDEKPEFPGMVEVEEYLAEMDAWLEKLKPYLELAKQVIETFNGPPSPEESIKFFQGRTILESHYNWLREVKEKAEKWDELQEHPHFAGADVERIIGQSELDVKSRNDKANKLEAIKKWYQHQLGNEVDPQDIRELGELLEEEE